MQPRSHVTDPSRHSSSSWLPARLSSAGKVAILLKDRLRCRSDRQETAGSKVSRGPTQLREMFSVLSDSRVSSSTGRDRSWFPCRSSRVRLLRLCKEFQLNFKKNRTLELAWARWAWDTAPDTERRETPAGCCGSGPDGGGVPAAAGPRRRPSGRTESPARYPTGPAVGLGPAPSAERQDSQRL